jgi:hypothetical protein
MMAITANTCRVCSERFLFGRGQGYAHDLCSLDCERDELKAKAQSLQRRCEELEAGLRAILPQCECICLYPQFGHVDRCRLPIKSAIEQLISPQQSKE